MAPIDDALEALRSSSHPNISATATAYKVNRTTLHNRFYCKATSAEDFHERTRSLNNEQEQKLIDYIRRQCEMCLPPTPRIVTNIASEMAKNKISKNWPARFVERHKNVLDGRYLATIDLARHRSESKRGFEAYFNTIASKMAEYNITTENIYNMDEKGFMIGQIQKSHRIFTRDTYLNNKLVNAGQDGNREWITCLATICADGSALSPALIYKANTGNLQDTWLDGFDPKQQKCLFSSSPNGWTSDIHCLAWLDQVFDKETKDKACRSWRLLFIDGHGSHISMKFLDRCQELKILLAIYPPHSTHKLQPLDVSCFRPLAHYYSDGLDQLIQTTLGFSAIKKRDFFQIFWPAWIKAFKKDTILSAWRKTGIVPPDPAVVLRTLKQAPTSCTAPHGSGKRTSMSFLDDQDSPRKVKRLRKEVDHLSWQQNDRKSAKIITGVYNLLQQTQTQLTLTQRNLTSATEALKRETAQKKRSKKPIEQLRSETEAGHVFFSPAKIDRIRAINMAKEHQKEQLQVDKQIQKDATAQQKLARHAEAQSKRQARAVAAAKRKEETIRKKAAAKAVRIARIAEKEAEKAAKALNRRRRVLVTIKLPPSRPIVEPPISQDPEPVKPVKTRGGRIVKRPAHLAF